MLWDVYTGPSSIPARIVRAYHGLHLGICCYAIRTHLPSATDTPKKISLGFEDLPRQQRDDTAGFGGGNRDDAGPQRRLG